MSAKKTVGLTLFCVVAILCLPVTVLLAIIASLGGDKALLLALRGKFPKIGD